MKSEFRLGSVLRARCPACHEGKVLNGVFSIHRRCPKCSYDLHPEPGFYLGAMVVGFLFTAITTVPLMIALKFAGAEVAVLAVFPLIEFIFVGTFVIFYCRILWLHLEYRMTRKLDES
jgi:uncharacterized protein (DUF983 family)